MNLLQQLAASKSPAAANVFKMLEKIEETKSTPKPKVITTSNVPAPFKPTSSGVKAAVNYINTPATEPKQTPILGGGGGIQVKPWWDILPTTPEEVITRSIDEPAIGAGAVIGGGTKIITQGGIKVLPAAIIGAGGVIGGLLLGGGGSLDQQQDATNEAEATTETTQAQDLDLTADQDATQTTDATLDTPTTIDQFIEQFTTYNIESGEGAIDFYSGDVGVGQDAAPIITPAVSPIQSLPISVNLPQITMPTTISLAMSEQDQGATQTSDNSWITLLAVAAVAIGGLWFLGRKKR